MPNARASQLYEQRKGSSGFSMFGDRRKILSPVNTSISSIAKRTANAETDAMVGKYNDGLVSNTDMQAFLTKTLNTPGISPQEKIDLEDKIRDFDSLVQKDRLESAFKLAPENSLQQAQAAKAVADFYNQRAAGMVAGTPAHSQAMENAGSWQTKYTTIVQNANTLARRNQRTLAEQKINMLPNNSSERSIERANMFKSLYDQAVADGDVTDANKYQAYYNQEVTNASELQTKEATREEKALVTGERDILIDGLNNLADLYHDNKISAQDFATQLSEIDQRAMALGNDGLSINMAVNRWSDKLAKDIQKGVKRGSLNGLPTVLGRGGTGGGAKTSWDKEDFDYSDDLRLAKAMLDSGKWDGNKYVEMVSETVQDRATSLEKRIESVYATAQENPNTKVYYNGKKQRAEDVLQSLYKEQETVGEQVQAVQSGTFGLVEVPPKEFNQAGDVSAKGKSIATYELVNTANMPQDQYVQDDQGIFHQILREAIQVTDPNAIREAMMSGGYIVDDQGVSHKLNFDKSGNASYYGGKQYVEVYEPGSAFRMKREYDPATKTIQGITDAERESFKVQIEQAKNGASVIGNEIPMVEQVKKDSLDEMTKAALPTVKATSNTQIAVPGMVETGKTRQDNAQTAIKSAVQSGANLRQLAQERVQTGQEPAPLPDLEKPVIIPPSTPLYKPPAEPTGLHLAGESQPNPIQQNAQNISNGRQYYIGPTGNLEQGGKEIKVPSKQIAQPPQPAKTTSQLNIGGNQPSVPKLSVPSGWKPTPTPKPQESIFTKIKNLATSIWPFKR